MASRKRRRPLSAEERRLWSKVVEGATPLSNAQRAPIAEPRPLGAAKPVASRPDPIQPFRIGQNAGKTVGALRALASPDASSPRMDSKAFTRMRRGKCRPEAKIDLHGLTASAAHAALIAFVLRAQGDGKRLVLVITGKGRTGDAGASIPETPGILRRQVPHWLETPPLAGAVLQVAPAHRRHGGSGACYVFLRRRQ